MRCSRRTPPERQLRLSDVACQLAIAKSRRPFFRRPTMTRRLPGRQRAVGTLDLSECNVGVDVADDRENGVPRMIEISIEANELFSRQRAQPRLPADAPTADTMAVMQQLIQRLRGHRAGIVRFALGFLNDDLELAPKLVDIDERTRISVRLHVEPLHESGGREHGVVARMVVDGAGIE